MQRSRYILTLLSTHSVSKSGYVQEELREALEMQARMPLDQIRIIPVRLDDCEPTHEQLRDLHWLDLFESYDDGVQQILSLFPSVGATGRSPLQNPLPLQQMTIDLPGDVPLELMAIPGGTFWMGSRDGEGRDSEHPRHQVTVAPFHIGKYPVTQAQWQAIMGNNPSRFEGADRPVECVSWNDCQEFLQKLNAVGNGHARSLQYRLPSEAEWEYACRAGTETAYYFGDDPAQLGNYAWFGGNSGGKTHPVGQKQSNAFRLYDIYGNVWEWCQDWFSNDSNPVLLSVIGSKLLRGGSWYNKTYIVRSAFRGGYAPGARSNEIGFRVVVSRTP